MKENRLIRSLQKRFRLNKNPNRIGDIIEYKNDEYLIIGIERVKLHGKSLVVTYTCQDLTIEDIYKAEAIFGDNELVEFIVKIELSERFKDSDWYFKQRENLLPIGAVFENKGRYFKWLVYTDIKLDSPILELRALTEEIKPVSPVNAKKRLLNYKREKIGLSIV